MMYSAHKEGALEAENRTGIPHQHETALDALAKLFRECCEEWDWEKPLTQYLELLLTVIQRKLVQYGERV